MDNLKGMGWMVLAMLGFALSDTFIKLTLGALPVGQVICVFAVGGALIFGLWAHLRGDRVVDRTLFGRAFLARLVAEMVGTVCFVMALSLIDLSMLSAIIQASPLLVTLGAAVFLGAPVGWRRWSAIGVGLVGVLIIIRPASVSFEVASLWAVGAAIGLSARDLATRAIPAAVSTLVLAAWGFAAAGLAGVFILAIEGGVTMPDATQRLQLVGALLCALVGYYAVTAAMRVGEIAVVTPFRYSRLIFALVLALLVFGERPDGWTLLGAGIVIGSGLYTLWRERRAAVSVGLPG